MTILGEGKKIKHILFVLVMAFASFSALAQNAEFQTALRNAESGDAAWQYYLGVMYEYGTGVAENDQEAVKWYRLAAESDFLPITSNAYL